jgi:thiamine monophosphate kinase
VIAGYCTHWQPTVARLILQNRYTIAIPSVQLSLQTVDFFRASLSDPYVFGRVAAQHALGDCHAMGATPTSALAIAVVPFAAEAQACTITHGNAQPALPIASLHLLW